MCVPAAVTTVWMAHGRNMGTRLMRWTCAPIRRRLLGERGRRWCRGRRGFVCLVYVLRIRETALILEFIHAV